MATDEKTMDTTENPTKIKLGDVEFSSDELQSLVGKAKSLEDFEKKAGQPWEEITKSWGQRGEVIGRFKKATGVETPEEFEERLKAEESAKAVAKVAAGTELSAEEQERVAKDTLKKYLDDLGYVTKDGAKTTYQELRDGEKLLSQVNDVLAKAKEEGKPSTDAEDLLTYMAGKPGLTAEEAYKLKFEPELEQWKEKQLGKTKRTPIYTEEISTAGAKGATTKSPKTTEELRQALREHFAEEGQ